LFNTEHCEGKVVYWPFAALSIVPFEVDPAGRIKFPVELDGKPLQAVLDTGSASMSISAEVAKELFDIGLDSPGVEKVDSNGTEVHQRKFKSLAMEGIAVGNPNIVIVPAESSGRAVRSAGSRVLGNSGPRPKAAPEMTMGMAMLGRLHVYIATAEKKLY